MTGNTWVTTAVRATAKATSATAPALAARLLARLFTTPSAHPPPARETAWMQGAQRHWIPFDGRALPIYQFGAAGPTVLLVHGWSGRGSQLGAFIAPLLDAGFRVVTYDAPAHGAADGRTSSLPEFARAVECVVDAIGPVTAIVAHSLGAAATTIAVARGLPVERLVYIAPPAAPGKYLARAGAFLGFSTDATTRAQQLLERRFDFPFEHASASHLAPGLAAKLLIVHDEDDAEVPHIEGRAIADAWPDARMLSTRGLGHRRIVRDADIVRTAVQYIAGNDIDTAPRSHVRAEPRVVVRTPHATPLVTSPARP